MERIEFDAGNEWANSPAVPTGPSQAAPTTTAPAEATPTEAVSTTDEPSTGTPSWADPDPKAAESTDQPAAKTQAPSGGEIEVKGPGGAKKFALASDNPELQRTLALGLGARKWQAERDQARKERDKAVKDTVPLREKAQVWDQLDELARLGQRTKVAHAVLGDEGYEALRKEIIREHTVMQGGDPDERNTFERERMTKDQELTRHMYEKKIKEAEGRAQAQEDKAEKDRLRSVATTALVKYDMRNFIEDQDLANNLNNKLWTLAWTDLEAIDSDDITPEMISKAFASNAKTLRAGMSRSVDAKVNRVIEGKKQDATRRAQAAATERYPTGGQVDLSQWDGRSSKGLLELLAGKRK
jgi:hypothetical protein